MKNKTKKTIIITVCLAAVAAGVILFTGKGSKNQKIQYETAMAEAGNIAIYVTATGTIEPVTEVEVGTQVSGIIDKLYADYNSIVKEGQLIAEMDKVTLESDLASAKATYQGSKAEYIYQMKNYERNVKLHEKGLVSDTDFELAEYNYRMAESTYNSSKAALDKAERNLGYATITSPIDGVVIDKAVEEGQTVAAGFETPTLFTIAADLTKMQVVADVDEADIGGVAEGQRVTFTVDAFPEDVFEGRVEQIRLGSSSSSSTVASTTTESVVTYEVVISADNPDLKLKPRLTANINIYTMEKSGVLSVPSKALRFSPVGPLLGKGAVVNDCDAAEKVWTREGNVFSAHPVTTGLNDGVNAEIISGIEEGTEVITDAKLPEKHPAPGKGGFMPGPPR